MEQNNLQIRLAWEALGLLRGTLAPGTVRWPTHTPGFIRAAASRGEASAQSRRHFTTPKKPQDRQGAGQRESGTVKLSPSRSQTRPQRRRHFGSWGSTIPLVLTIASREFAAQAASYGRGRGPRIARRIQVVALGRPPGWTAEHCPGLQPGLSLAWLRTHAERCHAPAAPHRASCRS